MKQIPIHVANKKNNPQGNTHYVGRPTALGNPFLLGRDGNREEVIDEYSEWLNVMLQDPDSEQSRELGKLMASAREHEELTLVCWCAPAACHADVVREVLTERLNGE